MQQAQVEEQRQKEANETALAAIGKPKKRKFEESTNHIHQSLLPSNGPEQISPIQPSPSSNVVTSANPTTTTKSVCLFIRMKEGGIISICFAREQLNASVVPIFAIYYLLWNEINILNEQHCLSKH